MSFGIVYEKEIGMFLNGSFSNSNYTKRWYPNGNEIWSKQLSFFLMKSAENMLFDFRDRKPCLTRRVMIFGWRFIVNLCKKYSQTW
jgi:hypothetical protein